MSELGEWNLPANPIELFSAWFAEARADASIRLPEAVHLATLGAGGYPEDRVVLLKDFSDKGFAFYTNVRSAKGKALKKNPKAALTFYWMALNRQVRIVGDVAAVTPKEADAYFATRPRGSQLAAWASDQSEIVSGRETLEKRVVEAAAKFPKTVSRPPYWSGFRLKPVSIEYWINRDNRLHDRFLYRKAARGWKAPVRLAP